MSDPRDLQSIWDDCWEKISRGEATAEDCIAEHPEFAPALRRMFAVARRLENARSIAPSAAFRAHGREELMTHARAHPRSVYYTVFPLAGRLALAVAAFIVLFFVSGIIVAQAALPGQLLYNWKLGSEQVFRAVYPDHLQADLIVANRRADELTSVAGNPKAEQIAADNYQRVISDLPQYSTTPQADATIVAQLTRQKAELQQAGINVPKLDQVLTQLPPAPNVAMGETPETPPPAAAPSLGATPTWTPSHLPATATPTPTVVASSSPLPSLTTAPVITSNINPCFTPTPTSAAEMLALPTPTPTPTGPNPCITPRPQGVPATATPSPLPSATPTMPKPTPKPHPTRTPNPSETSDRPPISGD